MEGVQRNDFFTELNNSLDSFPESFAKHKILPQLINAFEFGGAGSSVLAPLFKLGGLLKGEQYQKKIVPCVIKLFSSTDRATRLNLLQQVQFLTAQKWTFFDTYAKKSIKHPFLLVMPPKMLHIHFCAVKKFFHSPF